MNLTNKPTAAIIYDDHLLFAQAFAGFLERLRLFRQVRAAKHEEELMDLLTTLVSDHSVYFFLDYQLGDKNSLSIFNEVRHMSKRIKIIMVTSLDRPTVISNLLSYKPDAVISKASGAQEITECLATVVNGFTYLCPEMSRLMEHYKHPADGGVAFSQREIEILMLFNKGLSIVQAAETAHLSRFTIVNHRSNMMKKSGTKSIVELLAYARNKGIL